MLPGTAEAVPPLPETGLDKKAFMRKAQSLMIGPVTFPCVCRINVETVGLLVDTTGPGARGSVSAADLDWLQAEAARPENRVVFVMMHHAPAVPDNAAELKKHMLSNAAEVRGALRKTPKLAAVFSASAGVAYHEIIGGVHYIGIGELARWPMCYASVLVEENRVQVAFRTAAGTDELAFARKLMKKNKVPEGPPGDGAALELSTAFQAGACFKIPIYPAGKETER